MKKFTLVAGLLGLTACVGMNVQNFQTDMNKKLQREGSATVEAEFEISKNCNKGIPPEKIPRKETIKHYACAKKIYEAKILPVVVYPDLFQRLLAVTLENANLYQNGKITLKQRQSRGQIAYIEYQEAIQSRINREMQVYVAQDRMELEQMKAMADAIGENTQANIQRQQDSMPTHSTCTLYGNTAQCTTSRY